MPATLPTSKQLFPQLLGESWPLLAEKIQRMHECEEPLQATGKFYVRHGRWPAPWIAWIMGMPAAGETVELQLKVSQQAGVELWERIFAGRPMISRQSAGADGLLIERVGATEVYFRLSASEGALHFQTVGAATCFGPLRIPLPALLRPNITAHESIHAESGEIEVFVEVCLPLLGRLITYGGTLIQEGWPHIRPRIKNSSNEGLISCKPPKL
jgi:hypothetical protein